MGKLIEDRGKKIRARREALGWSRADLERASGVVRETLYRYETGRLLQPNPETFEKIEAALARAEVKK